MLDRMLNVLSNGASQQLCSGCLDLKPVNRLAADRVSQDVSTEGRTGAKKGKALLQKQKEMPRKRLQHGTKNSEQWLAINESLYQEPC